ncbi:MAG: PorP/SprF family type IX secretion system membrane protein [Bacteroidota bacterium]
MKRLFICLVFVLAALATQAQDIHFSQYYLSPLNLNPAMTGVMNCNSRIVGNYRSQWSSVLGSSAFRTYSLSYDQRIPVGRSDYFGIGGTFWGDRAGEVQFSTTMAKLSASYSKKMGGYRNKAHYLVVGGEAGIANRGIDARELKWPIQNDGNGGYDEMISSGEVLSDGGTQIYPDFSAGLMWFTVLDKNNSFYIGGAYYHLNTPNISFISGDDSDADLSARYVAHAGGDFLLNSKFGIVPGFIFMKQGPSIQAKPGLSLKFLLPSGRGEYQAFQVGGWVRVASRVATEDSGSMLVDAAILSTRFDYNTFSVGFSYDINLSDLAAVSNNNGGFELAVIYKVCKNERRNVYCPRF